MWLLLFSASLFLKILSLEGIYQRVALLIIFPLRYNKCRVCIADIGIFTSAQHEITENYWILSANW